MAKHAYYWNVFRGANHLYKTCKKGDSLLKVQPAGVTQDLWALAKAAREQNSSYPIETLVGAYQQINTQAKIAALKGYPVDNGLFYFAGVVGGNWPEGEDFNQAIHQRAIAVKLNKDFHDELKDVGLILIGHKNDADYAEIRSVLDIDTQLANHFITIGDDILISGERIKVVGIEPEPTPNADTKGKDASASSATTATTATTAAEEEVTPSAAARRAKLAKPKEQGIGVFFIPTAGGAPIQATRFNQNDPAHVNVRVPKTLQYETQYTLRIITRFSSGNVLLTTPRIIDYPFVLTTLPEED